jgi:hypothetical protein
MGTVSSSILTLLIQRTGTGGSLILTFQNRNRRFYYSELLLLGQKKIQNCQSFLSLKYFLKKNWNLWFSESEPAVFWSTIEF